MALARANSAEQMQALGEKYPGRFLGWFASADITKPEAADQLTKAVKSGAIGLGEIKFHVEAAGPELRRMYELAAELNVPILIHFQEVPHTPTEGVFSTGFKNFEAMLKAYPKTRFIGHADAFWANVSADYANQDAYPTGPIKRGGVTDKLLTDYANLFGCLSANSGNNALSRDPEFTADFLKRHQDKLIFGSDCGCQDGKGGGISQAGKPDCKPDGGEVRCPGDPGAAEEIGVAGGVSKDDVGERTSNLQVERLKPYLAAGTWGNPVLARCGAHLPRAVNSDSTLEIARNAAWPRRDGPA